MHDHPGHSAWFNLCMSLVLQDFRAYVAEHGPLTCLSSATLASDLTRATPPAAEGYIDVTFVDDCALLLHARSNELFKRWSKLLPMPPPGAGCKSILTKARPNYCGGQRCQVHEGSNGANTLEGVYQKDQ